MVSETILGRVVHADDGSPVADASVMLVSGPEPTPDLAAVTGSDGGFALGVPAGGRWHLKVFDQSGLETDVSVAVPQTDMLHVFVPSELSVPEED